MKIVLLLICVFLLSCGDKNREKEIDKLQKQIDILSTANTISVTERAANLKKIAELEKEKLKLKQEATETEGPRNGRPVEQMRPSSGAEQKIDDPSFFLSCECSYSYFEADVYGAGDSHEKALENVKEACRKLALPYYRSSGKKGRISNCFVRT